MEEGEKEENVDSFEIAILEEMPKNKLNLKIWGLKGWKAVTLRIILSVIVFCFFVYFFLLNLSLLSASVKIIFAPHAHQILISDNYEKNATDDPILGFFAGELSAALLQSSSAASSIVVSMVAEDAISVRAAFPVIMGANVGTTITSTIVSMALFSERKSLRRAFTAAAMHDMFNIFTSMVVLPIDWVTGGTMELITRKMVGINAEHVERAHYTLSECGKQFVSNKTEDDLIENLIANFTVICSSSKSAPSEFKTTTLTTESTETTPFEDLVDAETEKRENKTLDIAEDMVDSINNK